MKMGAGNGSFIFEFAIKFTLYMERSWSYMTTKLLFAGIIGFVIAGPGGALVLIGISILVNGNGKKDDD